MRNKLLLASALILLSPISWGLHSEVSHQQCATKSQLVERIKQHMLQGKFERSSGSASLVDRAIATRLGVSLQHRLHEIDQQHFSEWLKFQETCELSTDNTKLKMSENTAG